MGVIYAIDVYREGNFWFFDDASTKLKHEGLVAGVPEIIQSFVGDEARSARIKFSSLEFEGSHRAKRIDDMVIKLEDEALPLSGVRYQLEENGLIGWLCPNFWRYFSEAPDTLFFSVTRKDNS